MASTIKVNNIQNQCGANIVNKCSTTITLGASGDTIQLACGASQTGFGRTGTVDWDTTAKITNFTAVSGNGYFVNTTSGAITVTLPAGSAGSIVSLKDYANTWDTNNVTVTPNGTDKINGVNSDATLNTQDQSITLVYVDSTKGWRAVQDSTSDVTGAEFIVATGGTVTCCGDYKIHTFTGPGTFTVTNAGNSAGSDTVDYLVVAGAGGGGTRGGGGGGAGGYRESSGTASGCYTVSPRGACVSALPVTVQGYPITVGGGGTGAVFGGAKSTNGTNSVFSTITSSGGGAGGHFTPSVPNTQAGQPGGSGGGGNGLGAGVPHPGPSVYFPGGTGNTPPVSPPQGTNGGDGQTPYNVPQITGGGGGGAICAGQPGQSTQPTCVRANGGDGATSSINGTPTARAGGGGGQGAHEGDGGAGGGGAGGEPAGTAGTTNTGGGGGAGNPGGGGAGGSGIVIIRYKYQ